eukprot:TRINITY_DN4554_c0_g2_i1.p1 TRINITY_DN4554_c0_g2~~TRINITY_DN4554_c0_g2_i1.p1  ORF type:complete len:142 (-),score=9.72 TRINITY_DN4554_c0_g2_i1:376-801(-)
MSRRPPRSPLSSSSAASDVYKRQVSTQSTGKAHFRPRWIQDHLGSDCLPTLTKSHRMDASSVQDEPGITAHGHPEPATDHEKHRGWTECIGVEQSAHRSTGRASGWALMSVRSASVCCDRCAAAGLVCGCTTCTAGAICVL